MGAAAVGADFRVAGADFRAERWSWNGCFTGHVSRWNVAVGVLQFARLSRGIATGRVSQGKVGTGVSQNEQISKGILRGIATGTTSQWKVGDDHVRLSRPFGTGGVYGVNGQSKIGQFNLPRIKTQSREKCRSIGGLDIERW
jgi:hypothetical protein